MDPVEINKSPSLPSASVTPVLKKPDNAEINTSTLLVIPSHMNDTRLSPISFHFSLATALSISVCRSITALIALPIAGPFSDIPLLIASIISLPTSIIVSKFSENQSAILPIAVLIALSSEPSSAALFIPSAIPLIILVPTCSRLSKEALLIKSSIALIAVCKPLAIALPQPCDAFSKKARAPSNPLTPSKSLNPFSMLKNSVNSPTRSLIPSFTLSNACNKVSCMADASIFNFPLRVSSKFSAIS